MKINFFKKYYLYFVFSKIIFYNEKKIDILLENIIEGVCQGSCFEISFVEKEKCLSLKFVFIFKKEKSQGR